MPRVRLKPTIIAAAIITLCTCIDPYTPNLEGYKSQLVIEGLITNELSSYVVRLSKTYQSNDTIAETISDADVSISDDSGTRIILSSAGKGVYKTDSTTFTGEPGKSYTLHVVLADGRTYESEPSQMVPVPEIDSLYYSKGKGFTNNKTEEHEGIIIYLDSKQGDGVNNYFRWEYEETWKFKLPTIKKYNFYSDTSIKLLGPSDLKDFCYKQRKSSDIIALAFSPLQADRIKNFPIVFIGSDVSDRLTIQYSILVKQFSISEKEYKFWDNMYKMNENSGDIFGSQPYSVAGNISNVNDKNEKVLGYFAVSAVSKKRIDVTFMELLKLNLPLYHYPCKRLTTAPGDYCINGGMGCVPPTWNELYTMWTNAGFNFIEPIYDPVTRKLLRAVFATYECSDCETTGTREKPSFWVDR